MANMGLELALQTLGIPFARAKVGDRYVLEMMNEKGWRIGAKTPVTSSAWIRPPRGWYRRRPAGAGRCAVPRCRWPNCASGKQASSQRYWSMSALPRQGSPWPPVPFSRKVAKVERTRRLWSGLAAQIRHRAPDPGHGRR